MKNGYILNQIDVLYITKISIFSKQLNVENMHW